MSSIASSARQCHRAARRAPTQLPPLLARPSHHAEGSFSCPLARVAARHVDAVFLNERACLSRAPSREKNVHAIAPPISSPSTFGSSCSMTSIFPEIFDPPRIATNGRSWIGVRRRGIRAPSPSAVPQRPDEDAATTPAVEACARCAAPNASFTKKSPSSASARARRGSLVSSPPRKRVFSSRRISPGEADARPSSLRRYLSSRRKPPLAPISSARRFATGCSEYFGVGLSFRPAKVRQHDRACAPGRAGISRSEQPRGCACRR